MTGEGAGGARARAVLVAEQLPASARRVLRDAGCSFVDAAGHAFMHRVAGPGWPEVGPAVAARTARAVLEARSAGDQGWARFALRAGAQSPDGLVVLRHPVELLEWLTTLAAAREMHAGAKAYLYASDPDDILATLPFHPAPTPAEGITAPTTLVGVAALSGVG